METGSASRHPRSLRPLVWLVALVAATLPAAGVLGSHPAEAVSTCSLVASPTGSDSASGAEAAPFRTPQRLIDALGAGQTGCLRAGTYAQSLRFNRGGAPGAPITLTSYPGERATVVGRVYIPSGSNSVIVSGLTLNGKNTSNLPSPTVNSADVMFTGNDVTNDHTAICFDLGHATYGSATRIVIERNRIHGCGRLPATNHDHGIYNEDSSEVRIAWNLIYDNADRGINFYPDAQFGTVVHNVIDGNGEGILFSGDFGEASSNNTVAYNVISNAVIRHGVESWYPDGNPVGQNNLVHDNCLWGGAMSTVDTSGGGFTVLNNTTADPQFADRARGDFHMAPTSPCAAIAGDVQAAVDGVTAAGASDSQSPDPIPSGVAFYLDGSSVRSGPPGARVSVFATGAEPGFGYKLVSGRKEATSNAPCSADVVPIIDTVKFANSQGVIPQTAGVLNRPPGQWQICFLAGGHTVTGAATYTVNN